MRNYLCFALLFLLSALVIQPRGANKLAGAPEAFAPGPDAHGGEIVSKYDGFNHETVVTLKKMKVTCASARASFKEVSCVSIVASLHCPGIQLDYVRYATLQLVFEAREWDQQHPPEQRDLSAVADGETFRFGQMELVGQNVDTRMTETLQIKLPYKTFKRIVLAEFVELQVGKTSFELRKKNLAALRDLNNRVKP